MSRADENPPPDGGETLHWGPPGAERDLTGKTLGDFHVQRLLGRGGMGEVYLATQVSLNRPVALKVLRPDLLTRPTYLARFETEAMAVAKLNHPNIVHVYTLGQVDGVRFIAMEYVQGTNLREYLKKKGALDYPLALSIMRQAGMAVGAAGEIGLVHRDIKPENILLTRKGQAKVADFGLCRDLDADALALTQSGVTMGTPLYMSPEQAQGQGLDHRSDLYSLGVTFYHMLAGVPPFKAEHALALALKHVKSVPASLSVHRPDIPPALDRLILRLMAKAPGDRYQLAAEMLKDLAKVRENMSLATAPQGIPDVGLTTIGSVETPATAASAGPSSGSRPTRPPAAEADGAPGVDGEAIAAAAAEVPRRPRTLLKAGLVLAGLALGGGLGYAARPVDLLADGAPEPAGPPALWLAPGWRQVEKKGGAEAQYRRAQLVAPADAQEAAWLAVPGHFPASREWSARAYTQLARLLLRRGDADRLSSLADAIAESDRGRGREDDLVAVARAGVKALRGELTGVLEDFDGPLKPSRMTETALIELALEVTRQADRVASRPGAPTNPAVVRQRLREVQLDLVPLFLLTELRQPGFARPGRPGRPEAPAAAGPAAEQP